MKIVRVPFLLSEVCIRFSLYSRVSFRTIRVAGSSRSILVRLVAKVHGTVAINVRSQGIVIVLPVSWRGWSMFDALFLRKVAHQDIESRHKRYLGACMIVWTSWVTKVS
jgi:hypothetical protein